MGISLQHNLSRSHSSLPVLLPLHLPYCFILFWVLPSPITQSYLGLMVWRTCRKDNGVVNVCRWCWMIGRWRRSVLFGARSMALRIADKHLSAKQKETKTKTIFEHEQRDKLKSTELGGGSEPCPCWLGIMMYGSDQTACWAIMWEQRPPTPDSFSRHWWMATCLGDELSRERTWRLNSPHLIRWLANVPVLT